MQQQNQHIEYTNLITKGQAVERLIPYIGKSNIIGYLFDYDIPTRKKICNKITDAAYLMHTFEGKKCLWFSFIVKDLNSCQFPGVKKAMEMHPIANVIYNTIKAFSAVVTIECNRFYYTRLPKGKSNFVESDYFPTSTDSKEPSARMKRREFGFMLAQAREKMVDDLDNYYGYKFEHEGDYKYALHIDFKVFFNFSDKVTLAMFLKNSKWSGAFVTLLNWATRNQDAHRDAWRKSEEWFINYSEYHCSRNNPWWDIDLVNEMPFRLARPKTYEFWKNALWHELRDKGYTFDGTVIKDPNGNVLDEYGNVVEYNIADNNNEQSENNDDVLIKMPQSVTMGAYEKTRFNKENSKKQSTSDIYTIENWYRFINGKSYTKNIKKKNVKCSNDCVVVDDINSNNKAEPP